MSHYPDPQSPPRHDELDLELLKDLERQSIDEIRKLRAYERVDTKVKLVIQRGDSSRLAELRVQAHTSDVSSGGCCAITPVPLGVGDIYRLSFDRNRLDVPLVFARCVRCRLLREDAYESAFAFFVPIRLDHRRPQEDGGLLG